MTTIFLTQDYPPETGGIARLYGELCSHLPPGSVLVSTVAAPARDAAALVPAGPLVVRMPWPRPRAKLLGNVVRWWRWLRARLRIGDVTALQVGNIRPTGYLAAWAHARTGVPYVIYVHGKDVLKEARRARASLRARWTARRIFGGAAAVIANSRCTADLTRRLLRDIGCDDTRVHVVHPGTDPARFTRDDAGAHELRARLGITGPVLLSVARLMPRKGIDTTLEALAALAPGFPDLVYLIAGDGPDRARLEARADALRVRARVRFLGVVPDGQLCALYSASSIFVLPVREDVGEDEVEGFGIVYCEAAACGVPVVAGASGGTADAVRDGENGVLVAPGDAGALAAVLTDLLHDDERRAALGSNGRELVERYYNWQRAADEVWAIITSPAQLPPSRSHPQR